jgi:hypothetical protein
MSVNGTCTAGRSEYSIVPPSSAVHSTNEILGARLEQSMLSTYPLSIETHPEFRTIMKLFIRFHAPGGVQVFVDTLAMIP